MKNYAKRIKGIKKMFCENCGSKIEEKARFCDKCGKAIDISSSASSTKTKSINASKKTNYQKAISKEAKIIMAILIGSVLIIGNILMAKSILFNKDKTLGSLNNLQESKSKTGDDIKIEESNNSEQGDTKVKENDSKISEEKKEYKHNYKLIQSNLNWEEAKKYCESLGGHLATITSKEEEDIVLDLLKESEIKVSWLGATDLNPNGKFEWINGEELTYTNWAPNEPNNDQGVEHYLVLYKVEGEWTWNDGPMNTNEYYKPENIGFVCEWEVEE